MPSPSCSQCACELNIKDAYEFNERIYCRRCVQIAVQHAKGTGQPVGVTRYVDKSVCARCNTYLGESGGVAAGPMRLCLPCSELVQNWPYPQWLRFRFAALLLLLVVALAHGRRYFEAGRNLYHGEQLVEKGEYAEALPYLRATMQIAPNSDKGALLAAKAALLSGDVATADSVLSGHNGGRFENADSPQFREVDALWKRATSALDELDKAKKLGAIDGKETEAAKLAHHAATVYPELQDINLLLDYYDDAVAFANKDYDGFLATAEKDWNAVPAFRTATMLASAPKKCWQRRRNWAKATRKACNSWPSSNLVCGIASILVRSLPNPSTTRNSAAAKPPRNKVSRICFSFPARSSPLLRSRASSFTKRPISSSANCSG
jgi:tetratricopeptide (TPR) repeat protein